MTEPRLDKALCEIIRLAHPDRGLPDGELAHRITARCTEYLQTMAIAGNVRSNKKEIPAKQLRKTILESKGSIRYGAELARLSPNTYRERLIENGLYAFNREIYQQDGTTRPKRGPRLELPYNLKLRRKLNQVVKRKRLGKGIPRLIPEETIRATLKRYNNRMALAALYLDVCYRTLRSHMEAHGMYTKRMQNIQKSFRGKPLPKGVKR